MNNILNLERVGFERIERYAHFGRHLTHQILFEEIQSQNENREDFIIEPGQGVFEGLNFKVGDRTFPLDEISLISLAERFKRGQSHTVTRRGFLELSRNPELFQEVGNHFLASLNKPIQFRTIYGVGSAFPSNAYINVNHLDLMQMIVNTLGAVFEQVPTTELNHLDKKLLYSYVPIPDAELEVTRFRGHNEKISLGFEIRNSEVLENAVTINFKIMRENFSSGIVLANNMPSTYRKHIRTEEIKTTEDLISKVQNDLLSMFSNESMGNAFEMLDVLKNTMERRVSNGPACAEEFGNMVGLRPTEIKKLVEAGHIEGDESLYGWTLGPLTYLATNVYTDREHQEKLEIIAGDYLANNHLRDRLLGLLS